MCDMFYFFEDFDIANCADDSTPQVHSVYHSTELLLYLGPKIWDLVTAELKQSEP